VNSTRRNFLKKAAATGVFAVNPTTFDARAAAVGSQGYPYHGRLNVGDRLDVVEPGRIIRRIETFSRGPTALVRLSTADGHHGWGQVSNYDADLTVEILHRKLARLVLGQDPARIDAIVDRCVEANYKYPWSFICRALTGIDTALWDLCGRIRNMPVCELIGGKATSLAVYGSSMRRDITPEAEAKRLVRLRDDHGFKAFKIRVGRENGHDQDAAPGRTERIVPTVRKALGDRTQILADANSCYTPPKAIEVGRLLEQNQFSFFEEPCPYWELEWTAEVSAALDLPVAGGEQDNDLAQWRRMIRTSVVDIAQPDICYLGGFTRSLRVARMAEQAGIPVVPHSANLSLVTLFSMHLLACIPNAGPFVEFTIEREAEVNRPFYHPHLEVDEGHVRIPDAPGWGVDIDAQWLQAADRRVSEQPG
jgi:L-alanine-DL-glutamate epimerase-like enolase superfamily enzyme